MKYLKLKCGSGNVLEDTPKHLPDGIDNFCLSDIIAGPLTVIPKGSQKFEVPKTMRKWSNFSIKQARLIAKLSKYVGTIVAICSS